MNSFVEHIVIVLDLGVRVSDGPVRVVPFLNMLFYPFKNRFDVVPPAFNNQITLCDVEGS